MNQEQLTLLVAGIGLAGVVVGGLMGFLSTFLVQKWQEGNELRKERKAVIEGRLKGLEEYLDKLMGDCTYYLGHVIVRASKGSKLFENALDTFLHHIDKAHLIEGYRITEDKELIDLIEELRKVAPGFTNAGIALHVFDEEHNYEDSDERKQLAIQLNDKYNNVRRIYIQTIIRMDKYRMEQLGYKKEEEKKSIFSKIGFRKKQKELPKA